MPKRPKPIILTVLDGWGYSPETKGNAIFLARKPNYDELLKKFPSTLIHTSGPYVGLPEGQMGNSEVGHLNIGAGRIIHMDITRIDLAIASGEFFRNPLLLGTMQRGRERQFRSEVGHLNIGAGRIIHMDITRIDLAIASGEFFRNPLLLGTMQRGRERQLHLLGLLSDGGVHSHINHLFALLRMARENKVERVFVHCFTDGRDTPPNSGIDYLRQLQQKMREYMTGRIATVIGRYYAMDRDNRWERIERAYRATVHGEADYKSGDPIAAIRRSYEQGVTDEFVVPIVITGTDGASGTPAQPVGRIRDDDAVIFFNFRADRARQTTRALAEPGFGKFADPSRPKNLSFVAMTQYDKTFTWLPYMIGPEKVEHIL